MATIATKKPAASKPNANGSARKASTSTKSARQTPRRDDDGKFKRLVGRGRAIGVSRNQAAAGALAVTAVGIGVGLLLNWLRNREDDEWYSPAAFADGEAVDRDNFDQTRSAGPDAMRDENGDDWDKIDQALDESFPASDPPSTY